MKSSPSCAPSEIFVDFISSAPFFLHFYVLFLGSFPGGFFASLMRFFRWVEKWWRGILCLLVGNTCSLSRLYISLW